MINGVYLYLNNNRTCINNMLKYSKYYVTFLLFSCIIGEGEKHYENI